MGKRKKQNFDAEMIFEMRKSLPQPSNKAVIFGIVITVLWILGGALYISEIVGWGEFWLQPIDAIGSFFEGAFAPLLFLWIVVGFFMQQKDIAENIRNLERQARHLQLDTFMKVSDMVLEHLSITSGQLYTVSQGPDVNGRETEESMFKLWTAFQKDNKIFMRKFFDLGIGMDESYTVDLDPQLFLGTEIRRMLTEEYVATFEKLIKNAEFCDPEFIVRDAIISGTGQGLFYQAIKRMYQKLDEKPGGKVAVTTDL